MDLFDENTGEHIATVGNPDYSVLSGSQVDVDLTQGVSRQLSLDLLDVGKAEWFDPSNPAEHRALFPKRFLRVSYVVWVDDLSDWVMHPVFTGPISRVSRDQDVLHIEGQGKEALMQLPVNVSRIWKLFDRAMARERGDHIPITRFLRRAAEAAGETKIDIPQREHPTIRRDTFHMKRQNLLEKGLWPVLQKLARVLESELIYTGEGHLTLRPLRGRKPSYIFRDGENGTVINEPQTDWDLADFRNVIEIYGKDNSDAKHSSLLATWRLRHGGLDAHSLKRETTDDAFPLELIERVDTDAVFKFSRRTKRSARRLAHKLGDRAAHGALSVSFDALPVPTLEPGDLLGIETEDLGRDHFVLKQFSFPLTPGSMSVGYTRRVKARR